MKWFQGRSLARRMSLGFLLAYAAILLSAMLLLRIPLLTETDDNHVGPDVAVMLAKPAIGRSGNGILEISPTQELVEFAARSPRLWLIVSDGRTSARFGPVPTGAEQLLAQLPAELTLGELRVPGEGRPLSDMSVERTDTGAGRVRVFAGGVDPSAVTAWNWLVYITRAYMILLVPFAMALAVPAVLAVVPLVLRVLKPLVQAAEAIDPTHLDRRLPETSVRELLPIVRAFNAALDRLAAAFEQRRRFIADVAHELRTPVAVLGLKIDALPNGKAKSDLQRGVFRLGQLVGQMLDAQRLTLSSCRRETLNLVALARSVVADMGPLAMDAGYDIAVHAEADCIAATGDPYALARALTNLVGNAVAHGGGQGLIEVRVRRDGSIEVADQGPGLASDASERIFEPFSRERWDRDGCGLGLHLVREIMRAHGGDVMLVDGQAGATFRLAVPIARAVAPA